MKLEYDVPSIFQDKILCMINQQRERTLLGVQSSQEQQEEEEDLRQRRIILPDRVVSSQWPKSIQKTGKFTAVVF